MKIALIAALDQNNGIGKNNRLLCHLPADLKHFKQVTTGHSIIMGRKTFESLPNGPLPNRKNIVLTRNKNFQADGVFVAHTIEQVIGFCKNEDKVFVIGGEEIYKLFFEQADILHITKIHHRFEADAFFPEISFRNWQLVESVENEMDEKNKYKYSFFDYQKI